MRHLIHSNQVYHANKTKYCTENAGSPALGIPYLDGCHIFMNTAECKMHKNLGDERHRLSKRNEFLIVLLYTHKEHYVEKQI